MTNAVLYARVSSREQEQEGYSIEAQQKLIRSYASKNDIEVVTEFVDIETAKTPGRRKFAEMLKFLERSRKICSLVLVEKMDRLSRNLEDFVAIQKTGAEIYFVKTGNVVSRNSKPQMRFMNNIELASAQYYSDNLREEVKKGMHMKAELGTYPGRAPLGYRNNKLERSIEVHPENSKIVKRMFELYASGRFTLSALRKQIRVETGLSLARSYVHKILLNRFYVGFFQFGGQAFRGTHETFIPVQLFEDVQAVLHGHNRPKYRKHDIAFRGLLTCAHDDCTVTAELKKGKYVYYRCTGYRGKCGLPRFREEEIASRLGDVLKDIRIPDEILVKLGQSLESHRSEAKQRVAAERGRLEKRLAEIRRRIDQAYCDKLDGKIAEDFWQRKMSDWRAEEQQVEMAVAGLEQANTGDRVLTLQRCLELANKAYFLYLTRKPAEQAELLRLVLLNCGIDGVSLYPTYRKPFDIIFNRAKREEWSGR